jgi:hypothetical protein
VAPSDTSFFPSEAAELTSSVGYDKSPRGAILTLVLALNLPLEKAKAMVQTLLSLGASSAQAGKLFASS